MANTYTYTCTLSCAVQNTSVAVLTDEYQHFIFASTSPCAFDSTSLSILYESLVNCELKDNIATIAADGLSLAADIKGTDQNASFTISAHVGTYGLHTVLLGYASVYPVVETLTRTSVYKATLSSTNNNYRIDNSKVSIILRTDFGDVDITNKCYNTQDYSIVVNMPELLLEYLPGDIYVYANTTKTQTNSRAIGNIEDSELIRYYIDNNISQPRFRIYVLYPDETIHYEIPQEDIQLGGTYNENYQNGQRRTLSFTLYNEDGKYTPDIDTFWAGTRLRLDVGIQTLGDDVYWFQKGIFIITSAAPSLAPSKKTVSISASDKFSLFENSTGKLTGTYEIPVNTDVETLLIDILRTDTGDGYALDPQEYLLHSNFKGKKTQVEISKNAGDTFGSILLDIATQLSAEIYYNEKGNLVLLPIQETMWDKDKPLLYSFDTANGGISGLDFTFDYNSIINRIIVIGTSSSGGTFTAEAANNDPGSPLCYQRIGYRTGDIVNDSNIYSRTLAEERAEYELRQQLILKSSTSATVLFNPLLEVNNLVAVSDSFFKLSHERFLLQSLSYSLNYSNQMSISFSNLNNLPFTVS